MRDNNFKGRGVQSNPKNRFEKLSLDETVFDNDDIYEDEYFERKLKTVYFKDSSKTVISKNDSEDLGFNLSFNPYRGCEHGCVYCYARPTHEYLGFSSGLDFESKIMIKEDAVKLLEEHFKKKNYKPETIMFSGNTDAYQPIERKLELTRKALKVCLNHGNPVSIITKNSLIQRDIDILSQMAEKNMVNVMLSVTTLDRELARKMEPRTSSPSKRFEAIKTLAENKIPVGVNIAPVIPGLNDEEIPEILKLASQNGASFASWIMLRLPYSLKELFIDWLDRTLLDRKNKIINKIMEIRDGKLNDSAPGRRFRGEGQLVDAIENLFNLSCRKYSLNKRTYKLDTSHFKKSSSNQIEMF